MCSPTVEDESWIAASYEDSDQCRTSIACPHCSHRQFLDFFNCFVLSASAMAKTVRLLLLVNEKAL
ncbi:phage terminase large subunit family protein [Photorhabdus stackebrandtii]|uniref:Phage terminase large subunit GpA ATPase domain-containing protein n=1 Tax=Photorhabdus stackebrandtii TaxID=1123042 RepID=A0A7X5TKC1_9GAMM|nr:hypothetical protein [Photorhabdus stackebrandtii]